MTSLIWGVTDLTRRIKELLETQIDQVWVRGEISGWKVHPSSGHAYFTLKEERSVLSCVAWAPTVRTLSRGVRVRDGLLVRAFGRVTVYEPRGGYQLVVEQMLDEGEGRLAAAFEQMKRALEAEGLFDPSRKRPLPRFPRRIGVVTSPGGAAFRDILRILHRRWPLAEVVLRPVPVQGADAAAEIAAGIADLNGAGGIDVLIAGRGGGSLEDLWAFNEEAVARAVAASVIPVISAVGHEVDFTICDFAADVRAATPTHAAELATPDAGEVASALGRERRILGRLLQARLGDARLRVERARGSGGLRRPEELLNRGRIDLDRAADRLRESLSRRAEEGQNRLSGLARRLEPHDPARMVSDSRHRISSLRERLERSRDAILDRRRADLGRLSAQLRVLSPGQVLSRGYGIVRLCRDGRILTRACDAETGELLDVRLMEGSLACRVEDRQAPPQGGEGRVRS